MGAGRNVPLHGSNMCPFDTQEKILLNHDFYYPEILLRPDYPGISRRKDRWQRQAIVMWLTGQGFTMRTEIQWLTARLFSVDARSGALMRVVSGLRKNGLLLSETFSLPTGISPKFSFIRLSDTGKELLHELGWPAYESEWERMRRLHEKGNDQSRHTAAVLAFVYQARLRGWSAGVMPELDAGHFVPDALVEKYGESYYVEVELGEQKPSKWHNMARYQGVIALCGRTPEHRQKLLDEAKAAARKHNCPRLGTDLSTLFEQSDGLLWSERSGLQRNDPDIFNGIEKIFRSSGNQT
jgi:hypothetical protein